MKKRAISALLICAMLTAVIFTSGCGEKKTEEKVEEPVTEQEAETTPETSEEVVPEATPEIVVNTTTEPEITPEATEQPVPEQAEQIVPEQTEVTDVPESEMELCQVVHCNEFITLRTEPSTSGAEICKIPLGSNVYYLENAENGFVKISYEGQEGYSLASYLNFTKEDGAIFMKVYNCQESITLRKIPSTKAEEFCQIPLGEKVIFREAAENGFYMVSYNGYTGYALAEYLIEW